MTTAKMAVARIKLLRNKREAVIKQMRRDIALLLQSGHDATARIRVEHVIREQNIMAANEFLELFCELIVSRLSIIAKQRECPADLKEGISSLIFAAPRCSDIPELVKIQDIFEKKYGKDFVSAATDLRPNAGVNRMLIEKLSVRTPSGQVKLKVMKEIAKEYQIEWDTAESEMELLKPPEELIEGPNTFVSAASLPVKPIPKQSAEPNKPTRRYSGGGGDGDTMHFEDSASAAEAAAEAAQKAITAAEAAAYLAQKDPGQVRESLGYSNNAARYNMKHEYESPSKNTREMGDNSEVLHHEYKSQSVGRSHYSSNEDSISTNMDDPRKVNRRHSYNVPSARGDIKFDESDCDEEIEMEEPDGTFLPPNRPAPQVPPAHVKQNPAPRVHPKLPDYDTLAARFEALKYRKSQT
ncbi:uncharacterized protein LOC130776075 isoform X2 [Actinidia eriantha]|uniref:uncharacterized protein LOC130776075 isoform X2 n=1 Tax=Actinidia eriantha TaxID=165200 RepID=UPI00258ACD00|nr:uncharacterized protein LOC130776075 isoform X2 [Actinidia eriantha]